jgi:hypothetical protein
MDWLFEVDLLGVVAFYSFYLVVGGEGKRFYPCEEG